MAWDFFCGPTLLDALPKSRWRAAAAVCTRIIGQIYLFKLQTALRKNHEELFELVQNNLVLRVPPPSFRWGMSQRFALITFSFSGWPFASQP